MALMHLKIETRPAGAPEVIRHGDAGAVSGTGRGGVERARDGSGNGTLCHGFG